ncbi:MAG: hypothetical protein M1819_003380 [Sarea resinae]|nr:MAG: hypothetical protein M1819_003380 [Sarea resinae]
MVADALIYHPTVSHYLRFAATTLGRDKVLRTLQYFSRFLAWYLYRTNHPASQIAPFNAIKKQFSLSRKLLRVGKFVENLKAAATASDNKTLDPVIKLLTVGRNLGYAAYLSLDTIAYLDASGIRSTPLTKRAQKEAYKAWFTGLIFGTLTGIYQMYTIRQRSLKIDRKDGESVVESKKLERERAATSLQLVSDLCDLTIPSSALGYANLDDGIVGLAGTASSLIGARGVWKKTA